MFSVTYGALWLLILAQGAVILFLVRELSELRAHVGATPESAGDDSLPVGSPAPRFTAIDLISQQAVDSRELTAGRPVHVFLSTECRLCMKVAAELPTRRDILDSLVVHCVGDPAACRQRLGSLITLTPSYAVTLKDASAFRFAGFPAMVTFDSQRRIADIRYPSSTGEMRKYVRHLATRQPAAAKTPSAAVAVAVEDSTNA